MTVQFESPDGKPVDVDVSKVRIVTDLGGGLFELDLSLGCSSLSEYVRAPKVRVKGTYKEIMSKVNGKINHPARKSG